MTRYADQLKKHLKELKPQLYKELVASGGLDKYCQEKAEQAYAEKESLMKHAGLMDFEADEIARASLYS